MPLLGVASVERPGLLAACYLGLVLAFAVLANAWTGHEPGFYAGLQRPWFQPPDAVFGIMWPLNFLALAVVGVLLAQEETALGWRLLPGFALMVLAALGWAYLFYVPHALVAAAVSLGAAAVVTWGLLGVIATVRPWWALLMAPYACWLTVATALSVGYAQLN